MTIKAQRTPLLVQREIMGFGRAVIFPDEVTDIADVCRDRAMQEISSPNVRVTLFTHTLLRQDTGIDAA